MGVRGFGDDKTSCGVYNYNIYGLNEI
jgi:hypothetical protein